MKLSKLMPDRADTVSRETLLIVADFVHWLAKNKSEAFQAAVKAEGGKVVKNALNDLETHCDLWR